MLVILDANVFCADFQMRGNAFRVFMSGFRRAGLKPCVPDSVVDEVLNKYKENCDDLAKQAAKLSHDAQRLVGQDVMQLLPDQKYIDNLYSEYSSKLLKAIRDFDRLPYPSISHKELAQRALTRRRPFRERDGGYRDSLLWLSLLEYLDKDRRPVAFVTNNTRDFGSEGELHEHLIQDLNKMDLSSDAVTLFSTLSELNDTLILPTLKRLDEVRQKLADQFSPVSLQKWAGTSLLELLKYEEGPGPLEYGHGKSRISGIKAVRSVEIDATRQLGQDEVLVSAHAEVDAVVHISVNWGDYLAYEDVRELFHSDEFFSLAVTDLPLNVLLGFTLILSADSLTVLSSEIDWYEDDYGQVDYNPHIEDPPIA